MTRRVELSAFLIERRARCRPMDVGLPAGPRRRVPGLRREEVAELAGISVTWYTLIERGDPRACVSPEVVDRIADALRLDVFGRSRLAALALPRLDTTAQAIRDAATLDALQPVADLIRAAQSASINELIEAAITYINRIVDLRLGNTVIQSLGDGRVEVAHGTRIYQAATGTKLDDSGMLQLRAIAHDGNLDVIEDAGALPHDYRRLLEPFAVGAYCAIPIEIGRDYPIFLTAASTEPAQVTPAQRAMLRLGGDFAGTFITRSRPGAALLDPW